MASHLIQPAAAAEAEKMKSSSSDHSSVNKSIRGDRRKRLHGHIARLTRIALVPGAAAVSPRRTAPECQSFAASPSAPELPTTAAATALAPVVPPVTSARGLRVRLVALKAAPAAVVPRRIAPECRSVAAAPQVTALAHPVPASPSAPELPTTAAATAFGVPRHRTVAALAPVVPPETSARGLRVRLVALKAAPAAVVPRRIAPECRSVAAAPQVTALAHPVPASPSAPELSTTAAATAFGVPRHRTVAALAPVVPPETSAGGPRVRLVALKPAPAGVPPRCIAPECPSAASANRVTAVAHTVTAREYAPKLPWAAAETAYTVPPPRRVSAFFRIVAPVTSAPAAVTPRRIAPKCPSSAPPPRVILPAAVPLPAQTIPPPASAQRVLLARPTITVKIVPAVYTCPIFVPDK